MEKIRTLLLGLLVSVSLISYAEVAEVYQWKAFPGKQQDMLMAMARAAKIHLDEGAQVSINAHNIGSTQLVDYILRWDDSKKYAQSKDLSHVFPLLGYDAIQIIINFNI